MKKTTFWEKWTPVTRNKRQGNILENGRSVRNLSRIQKTKTPHFSKIWNRKNGDILENIKSFFFNGAFLRRLIWGFLILIIVGVFGVWAMFLRDTPPLSEIENPSFLEESTVMYDNDGNEIFRYWENGKRIYIPYSEISPSIVDALVAAEDHGFFENPGVDVLGLMRAGLNYVTGRSSHIQGTSTLSQQLIKNTLLTNERSLKRKIQEAYLAYRLNQEYSKEKILEMYLNIIEFGQGAIGVEQASLTFFGKHAKDVWPLGATILASIPKGPTAFSPYSKRDRLMGKIEAYPSDSPSDRVLLELNIANGKYAPVYNIFKEYIKNLKFTKKWNNAVEICGLQKEFTNNSAYLPDSRGCKEVNYDDLLYVIGNIAVKWPLSIDGQPAEDYTIEYTVGRKDYVASQMLRYDKISPEIFGKIIYDGLEFQFQSPTNTIKYPYFVIYVQEQLEAKYGSEFNIKRGLKVYTTLRPNLQEEAEKIIKEQVASNSKNQWATSASLVAMDNTTWEIVSMVGWPNYQNNKNNMTTALRQPGSSFKPLVYGLAISKRPIWPETPIADVATKFGKYVPSNYDRGFKGIMSVGKALAYSRNIPAIKMYFLAGNEKEIIPFVKNLGITTLKSDFGYGAPLAIGSGEVKAVELMQAYSVFANEGIKREAYAIKRIEDSQGGIIEERTNNKWQEVFSPAAAYIVDKILSENNYRPDSTTWRNNLTIPGKTVAAKTGTSNLENKKTGTILPRDTWTIGYSPNITTVVWAGNVDGSALKGTCDGINCAAPAWKKFMTYALKDLPNTPFKKPEWLFEYKTARLSGLLSSGGVENMTAIKLTEQDAGTKEVKIDSLCGWPVTAATPEDSIITGAIPSSNPIIDRYDPEWLKWFFAAANLTDVAGLTNGKTSTTPCERPQTNGSVNISTRVVGVGNNILEINWSGDRLIGKLRVTVNGKVIKEATYEDPAKNGSDRISTTDINPTSKIEVDLMDVYGYRYSYTSITTGQTNTTLPSDDNSNLILPSINDELQKNIPPPTITVTNPSRGSINIYQWNMFNLRFTVASQTTSKTIAVTIDGENIQNANAGDSFVIPIVTTNLSVGAHTVTITATDANKKTESKNITLNILAL